MRANAAGRGTSAW